MKYLLISLLFIFSANAEVKGNFVPISKFKNATTIYRLQSRCESAEGENCVDKTGKDTRRWEVVDGIVVPDAAGITAADAADAQKDSDQSARDTAKPLRETALQACVQDSKNPTLTPQQIKDCMAALVREILKDKVAIPDL